MSNARYRLKLPVPKIDPMSIVARRGWRSPFTSRYKQSMPARHKALFVEILTLKKFAAPKIGLRR
ncbi:uncharacterized protein BO87DRAFT_126271 [Aspergillus neoniger CBS 115656]|uniref:Uncharacterized protein n=1 Tax=Aspergillus neoniger (strain CBS 115656) TaxID=1448310 RepID=A0A318YD04_ASPNB|nr:hypothetical protein BO87DRAFT_126271 [Aspergillus neoniger CBS 115656]PYH31467.1 hypothetical protein BO87DRAFT_126271 [Aspergillus neoniger CBS 115656]